MLKASNNYKNITIIFKISNSQKNYSFQEKKLNKKSFEVLSLFIFLVQLIIFISFLLPLWDFFSLLPLFLYLSSIQLFFLIFSNYFCHFFLSLCASNRLLCFFLISCSSNSFLRLSTSANCYCSSRSIWRFER